jgi:hypothetical protein
MSESANWIAVASAEHVGIGRAQGFMQVNHGKAAPLRRVLPGSRVVYYSPARTFGGKDKLQSFTALGVVKAEAPYQFDMGGGFHPFRRGVDWLDAREAAIQPLLPLLEFAAGVRNWGQKFRFGLFSISDHDMAVIANAMGAPLGH